MTLRLARAAAPLAALLVISATLLAGCSGDDPDSSEDEPTTSESTSAEPSESATSDEPTDESTEETTAAPTAGSNEGCDLITPEEAEEILGGALEDPLESPPSIECQYVLIAGGETLDLYKGDAATAVLEAQEDADPEFALEPVDGVGEEAQVASFAGCGGVYFRTSDGTWWFLTTVCESDAWESRTRQAMIDLTTTIVSRLES